MTKLLLTVDETAKQISVGRTKAYELVATKQIPSIRIGRSVRVPVDALVEWIARNADAHDHDHAGD